MTETPLPIEAWKWLARRQLGVAVFVILITTGLRLTGKIDEARWADVTIWIVGLYMLGDAAGAWAATWKKPT
jgi:hypothetical protein